MSTKKIFEELNKKCKELNQKSSINIIYECESSYSVVKTKSRKIAEKLKANGSRVYIIYELVIEHIGVLKKYSGKL